MRLRLLRSLTSAEEWSNAMGRSAPWLAAAVCALLGSGLWAYRAGLPTQAAIQDPKEVVRRAWTEGRRVALEGEQEIQPPASTSR